MKRVSLFAMIGLIGVLALPDSIAAGVHTFNAGLSLISVPTDYSGQPLATVLGYDSPVLAVWDPTSDNYALTPAPPANSLAINQGYWVRFPAAATIASLGTAAPTQVGISLQAGWNMIGCPQSTPIALASLNVVDSNNATHTFADAVSGNLVDGQLYGWHPGDTAYEVVSAATGSLVPYDGYWLYATQACQLTSVAGGVPLSGMVTVPTGFTLPLSELAVSTEDGQFPVSANGSFSGNVSATGPRIVQLVDMKTDKVVLLGYGDAASSGSPFANGQGQISATTTADALLFLGLEGGVLPTANWSDLLNLIRGSTQEAQVASIVSTSIIANPTAISDGDTAIENALGAIQSTSAVPSVALFHQNAAPIVSVQRVVVSHSSTTAVALVNVSPGSPQSTLVVEPNPNGGGIVPVSNSRRRCALFIYKVASGPSASSTTPISPPQEVWADLDVEPEREIGSFFTSIANGLAGNFSYMPAAGAPILLEPDPVQEVAVYDVVAVGPGSTDTFSQVEASVAPSNQPEQDALDAEWRAANTGVYLKVVVKDIVMPTLLELIMGSAEAGSAEEDPATETAVETIAQSLPDVSEAIAAHNIRTAISDFFTDFKSNVSGIQSQVVQAVTKTLVSANIAPQAAVEHGLTRLGDALTVTGVISKCLAVLDITNAVYDNTIYNTADLWVANVLQPKITLSPSPAYVNDIQNIATLTAQIQGETDLSSFRFQWSTTGAEGSLEEPFTSTAMPTGLTSFSQAAYVANLTQLKNGNADTVTVTAYDASDTLNPLGSATVQIRAQPGLENGTFSIDSSDVFPGIVKNDPWIMSAVLTCPLVQGATSYIVEASGTNTGTYVYYVNTSSGGSVTVLDGSMKPYDQYVVKGGSVVICMFGLDAVNVAAGGGAELLMARYPITTVDVTYH